MKLGGDNKQFVLAVGDDGAILVLAEGNRLIKRIFCPSPASPEFLELLNEAPKAPISILVDVVDQSYSQQPLPPVNKMNVSKLVNRKLEKDFDANDLKAAIFLGREKDGRKEWNYLFVSVRNVSPLSDWIETVSNVANPFKGIFLLPVEAMHYLRDLRKATESERKTKDTEWQVLVSHNRVGGFRQIVFHKEKVVFTRIAQPVGGQSPDVTAGNIEQETLNTVEYIRRLGFEDSQGLDIYIIASAEVKAAIQRSSVPSSSRLVLTPFEVSQKLNLNQAAEERDRYGDVVAAVHFITHKKHVLKLTTPYNQQIERFNNIRLAVRGAAALVILALVGMGISDIIAVQDINEQHFIAETNKKADSKTLSAFQEFTSKFKGENERISELTDLTNTLSKDRFFFFDVMNHYKPLLVYDASVADVTVTMLTKEDEPSVADVGFTVDFLNRSNQSLDQLLDNIDRYTVDARKAFNGYKVTFEGLPNGSQTRIDLAGGSAQAMSIKMKISGPVIEDEEVKGKGKSKAKGKKTAKKQYKYKKKKPATKKGNS